MHRFMSPLSHSHLSPSHLSPSRLSSAWLCSISFHVPPRPRLEVLNASQNRIQCIAGLSFLPSLVVLNLGECPCTHKSASGIGWMNRRWDLSKTDLPPRPHRISSLWQTPLLFLPKPSIIPFSHASLGPIQPPFLLIFVLVV